MHYQKNTKTSSNHLNQLDLTKQSLPVVGTIHLEPAAGEQLENLCSILAIDCRVETANTLIATYSQLIDDVQAGYQIGVRATNGELSFAHYFSALLSAETILDKTRQISLAPESGTSSSITRLSNQTTLDLTDSHLDLLDQLGGGHNPKTRGLIFQQLLWATSALILDQLEGKTVGAVKNGLYFEERNYIALPLEPTQTIETASE